MKIENGTLICPHCNGDYLHHDSVEIWERREDANAGLHVVVNGKDIVVGDGKLDPLRAPLHVDHSMIGNPSDRRHGLAIRFWCEQCDARSSLTIAQHKGMTLIAHEVDAAQLDANTAKARRICMHCQHPSQLVRRKDGAGWRALNWCAPCGKLAHSGSSFVTCDRDMLMKLPVVEFLDDPNQEALFR